MSTYRDATPLPTVQLPPGWCVYVPAIDPSPQDNLPSDLLSSHSPLPLTLSSTLPPDSLPVLAPFGQILAAPVDNVTLPNRYPQQRKAYPCVSNTDSLPLHPPLRPYYQQMPTANEDLKRSSIHYTYQRRSTSTHTPLTPPLISPQPQWIPPPPPSSSAQSLPPMPPFEAQTRRGSPFTVYHVCVVCRRPRSARYHREHPFQESNPLPSNGVCHHCRSKGVIEGVTLTRERDSDIILHLREETSDEERQQRSSHSDPKSHRSHTRSKATIKLGEDEPPSFEPHSTSRPSRKIVYHHVDGTKHVVEASASSSPSAKPEPPLSPRAAMAEQQASVGQFSQNMSLPTRHASVTTKASLSSSDVRRIAREELKRYSEHPVPRIPTSAPVAQLHSYVTPSEARRIAHTEIERYRGAERLLEKHPHAFSHGTVQPVNLDPQLTLPLKITSAQHDSSDPAGAVDGSTSFAYASIKVNDWAPQSRAETFSVTAPSATHATASLTPDKHVVSVESQTATAPSAATRTAPQDPKDADYIIVERDVVEEWPDATRRHSYQDWETTHQDVMEASSYSRNRVWLTASTVEPSSSISQRPPNHPEPTRQQAYSARDRRGSSTSPSGYLSADDNTATGRRREDASAQRKQLLRDDQTQAPGRFGWAEEDAEFMSGALPSATSHCSARDEAHLTEAKPSCRYTNKDGHKMHPQHSYDVSEQLTYSEAQASRRPDYFRSRQAGPTRSDRRSSTMVDRPPAKSDRGSEYYPSFLPMTSNAPKDSVAMLRAGRLPRDREHTDRSRPSARYVSRQESQRLRPSSPRSEDIISDRRAVYRERSSSSEHIVTERLVRTRRRSPDRQSRTDRPAFDTKPPRYADDRGRTSQHPSEPPPRHKSILHSRSGSPRGPEEAYYVQNRVAFASHDDIATLPSPPVPEGAPSMSKGMGLSRFLRRSHGQELDGQGGNYGESRGRSHYTDDDQETYVPEPNRAITRAFSESPSRERCLSIPQQYEESYSHGPYHAEVSPTASMEVLTDIDDSRAAGRSEGTGRLFNPKEREAASQRSRRQREEYMNPAEERGWTRYVNVKKYRDKSGPWVEVKETVVLDDDARGG